jgi:hypothetical protein
VISNAKMFGAASALTAVGIVLVLANWYTKPDAALAWAAALAVFAAMVAALRVSRLAVRRAPGEVAAARSFESITTAVVFGALMMGIPLALTIARSYGLIDGSDAARRSTGVLTGLFLVMLGNAMPKNLPPVSAMRCDGARQQAFHRLAGWTWVLCGLASAAGWLALSIDSAEAATIVLVVTAMAVTIGLLLRLRRPRKDQAAHGLN